MHLRQRYPGPISSDAEGTQIGNSGVERKRLLPKRTIFNTPSFLLAKNERLTNRLAQPHPWRWSSY